MKSPRVGLTGGADPFPEPTVGLVLPYGFLWSDQHDAGATEARKDARPCAITTELNRFTWPGFDLRRTPTGAWVYGKLPREVVQKLRERIAEHQRRERLRQVDRDD